MATPKSTKREQQLCQFMLEDLSFEHSPFSCTPNHIYPPSCSNKEERDSKIQLQIELQNGQTVLMFPKPHEQPAKIAEIFCQQHNLDSQMITILAESIKKSINRHQQSNKSKYTLANIESEPSILKDFNEGYSYPLSCKIGSEAKSRFLSKKSSVSSQISLYEKGCRRIQQRKKWIQREREQNSINQIKQCTHVPSINELSRSIASQRSVSMLKKNKSVNYIQERTDSKHLQRKDSLKLCYSIVLGDQLQDMPEHKKQSVKNIRNIKELPKKSIKDDIFLQLYQNSRVIKKNRAKLLTQIDKQKSHQPKIDPISREIVGNLQFNDRLAIYERKSQLKKQKRSKAQKQQKQNLYKPKTGPAPPSRNIDKLPIGDYLFKRHKKTPVVVKPMPVPQLNKKSKILYQANKKQAFSRIFQHLDVNNKGQVSWGHLNFQQIQSSIRDILIPLLEEIQIMKIQLNQTDFKIALNFLFDTLPLTKKHTILNFHPNSKQPQQQVLVVMNGRSRELISKSSRAEMDVYDYGELRKAMRDENVQNIRVEQQRRQMQQCTFHPKLERKSMHF